MTKARWMSVQLKPDFPELPRLKFWKKQTDRKDSLRSIAWSPSGGLVATGSSDRTLRV